MVGMCAYVNGEKTVCACMSVKGFCLDGVDDRMMMGADQSPKVFLRWEGLIVNSWKAVGEI